MASISIYSTNSNLIGSSIFSARNYQSCSSAFESTSFTSKSSTATSLSLSVNETRRIRLRSVRFSVVDAAVNTNNHFDVVIVGAGIIGLTIARQFLIGSDLSVAVVDKAVPCSGATGAGQGYIWLGNKTPESDTWELAKRSHRLWEMLAKRVHEEGMDPLEELGWKKTGSLLVGRTLEESIMLKRRVNQLTEAGLRAEYLSSIDLLSKEPELFVGNDGGAAFFPDDCQLDACRAASFIEKANRQFASKGRYTEFYNEAVIGLIRSISSGDVEAVQTSKNMLYGKKAIVLAAGSWSGLLMEDLVRGLDITLNVPVEPRKGHLLVLENFSCLQLNHGLMEMGYIDHQVVSLTSGHEDQRQTLFVSMTATMDLMGNLVLGSSRQFSGFNIQVDESVVLSIWKRAGDFFPKLREQSLTDFIKSRKVRIGLRPYMPDGKPVIGPVPGLSNIYLATGHEGEGLTLALGTAEMVADMVLGNTPHVDRAPYSVQGRCCLFNVC
ncbi:hypothetical protein SLE2022_210900 [Rubroshorea leprosula]